MDGMHERVGFFVFEIAYQLAVPDGSGLASRSPQRSGSRTVKSMPCFNVAVGSRPVGLPPR